MANSNPQTTAIALPERVPALLRIYDDLLSKFTGLVLNTFQDQRKRGQRLPSPRRCREVVEQHVIWDPKNPGVPLVGRVAFEPESVQVTFTLGQKEDRDGNPLFDKAGDAVPWLCPVQNNSVTCNMNLPGSKSNPHEPTPTRVQPAFSLGGMGNPMGYACVDEQGALRMVPPMMSIFIKQFNIWTGEETGGVWMIPMGIAGLGLLDQWNSIVRRLALQGSSQNWEPIEPMIHALGYPGAFVDFPPIGAAEHGGLMPSFRSPRGADFSKPDGWIVGAVFGKIVKLDPKSQPIVVRHGEVPVQRFSFVECLNVVRVKVLGLPEEIGNMEGIGQTVDMGEARLNVLELFGVTLYDVHPGSGVSLIRNGLQNPPVDRMTAWGLIPSESTLELAAQTLRGMSAMIREQVEQVVTQALKDLVHNLSPGGRENPGLSLADVLGGDPTGELLAQAYYRPPTQDNLLVVAILSSKTAGDLGLEAWDPSCWVLKMVYKALLLGMAKQADIELPPPPKADETTESSDSGAPPPNGASAPAIIWHEGMKRDKLYELARDNKLDDIASKANKPTLVMALQKVCAPTPPA